MDLIVCVDDKMGMAFNGRRLSRDRIVCEDISKSMTGKSVYMDERSCRLFDGMELMNAESAETADSVFLEFSLPSELQKKPEHIILYHWNRHYPSDMMFDLKLDEYILKETSEFSGSSHEKITKEVYACEK